MATGWETRMRALRTMVTEAEETYDLALEEEAAAASGIVESEPRFVPPVQAHIVARTVSTT